MREIQGFPGYFISDDGQVFSSQDKQMPNGGFQRIERFLKAETTNRGYLRVVLYREGIPHKKLLHRLVAEAFVPNPSNLPEVNHKDGNKENNLFSNLEWTTPSGNQLHSYQVLKRERCNTNKNGRLTGTNNGRAKLDESKIPDIKQGYDSGLFTMQELADNYLVSKTTIYKIIHNKLWLS